MFENDMPAKRQFIGPEKAFTYVLRGLKYAFYAGVLYLTAWWFAPPWVWHIFSSSAEVQAKTPPVAPEKHAAAAAPSAPVDASQLEAKLEAKLEEKLEQFKVDACHALKLDYNGETCVKPPPPPAWSGEGITGRKPMRMGEAQEKLAEARENAPDPGQMVRDSLSKFFRHSDNVEDRREEDKEEAPPPRRYGRMADSGPQPGLRLRHQSPRDCREGQYWDPDAWFGHGGCLWDHGDR